MYRQYNAANSLMAFTLKQVSNHSDEGKECDTGRKFSPEEREMAGKVK